MRCIVDGGKVSVQCRRRAYILPLADEGNGDGGFRDGDIALFKVPSGRAAWTMRMLGDRLVELGIVDGMSAVKVHQALKETA